MKDATVTVGTSPDVLQHYLTAGIPIRTPDGIGKLVGLGSGLIHHPVEVQLGRRLACYKYSDCLPVLLPFSALTTPLEDGTVPACELAKLIYAGGDDPISDTEFKDVSAGFGHFNELVVTVDGAGVMCIYSDWLIDTYGNCMVPPAAYDYLRSKHFAVGLEPHQFIEKAAPPTPSPIQEGAESHE